MQAQNITNHKDTFYFYIQKNQNKHKADKP